MLVKTSYDSEETEFKDVKGRINNNWLWVFHVDFWLPENAKSSGMYSIYDVKALGTSMKFNKEELEEKLRGAETYQGVRINRDNGVAFAPRSTIYLGKQTDWNKFAINGQNIAIFFPEGAENLKELGKNHFKYGYNWGVTGNNNIEVRVSALDSNGARLFVYGDWVDIDGYAFGVVDGVEQ